MFYNLKKAFKAIGAWMQNVFAAIMRNCFPQVSCKYFTKKGRRNAEKFLPSLKEQQKAFNAMFTIVVPQHVWSKEFRIWLLQMKEYHLIEDCASQEELAEVLFKPCDTSIRSVAVRRCTPTHATILRFVNETENFLDVCDLARAVPTAFESLTPAEVFGKGTADRREFMWAILSKYPQRATDYIALILADEKLRKNVDDVVVPTLVDEAISQKIDLMPYLADLYQYDVETYAKVREHAMDMGKYAARLVLKGFSLTQSNLHAEKVEGLNVSIYGSLQPEYDALAWLYICYLMIEKEDICNMILSQWDFIKSRVSDAIFKQLCQRMVNNSPQVHQMKTLVELVSKEMKPKAIDRLLSLVEIDQQPYQIKDFYPFASWDINQQKKAIKILAWQKGLPMERFKELSDELQAYALEQLEVASEFEAIARGSHLEELVKVKLHPASEAKLLTRDYNYLKQKFAYLEAFEISDEGFKGLITAVGDYGDKYEQYPEMIIAYAQKHGLSDKKYQLLMGSRHAGLAPQLRQYLKKNKNNSVIVLNTPDLDEVPEA